VNILNIEKSQIKKDKKGKLYFELENNWKYYPSKNKKYNLI
jgi:hypothetical protein